MGSEWPRVRLGDYVDSCLGKMLDKEKNRGSLLPYLGNKNVRWGSFDLNDLPQMRFEEREHERYGLKYGDLVVCEGGEPGRCAIWKDEIPGIKIQKALHRIRPVKSLDNVYLHYWFLWAGKTGALEPYFTGTTIKHLTGRAIADLELPLPHLDVQKSIARILGALDDKIELNRQINTTLEAMAQALFKSWFVDFDPVIDNALAAGNPIPPELAARAERRQQHHTRANASADAQTTPYQPLPAAIQQQFPDRFVFTEAMGWVPEGWEVKYLNDVARIVYGKNLPKTKILDSGYPVYGGNGIIGFFDRYLYESPHVLISCRGAASGKVHLSKPFSYVTNNSLVIDNEESYLDSFYIYQALLGQDLTSLTTGSAQPQMTIENMNPVQLLAPSREIVLTHFNFAKSNFNRCLANISANEHLVNLRDALLPKLLSDQLRIPDAEAAVEKALAEA